MIRFESDYTEGAHEKILEQLVKTNYEQTPGYGQDVHCEQARQYIKKACANDNLAVHFLVGGTQANTTVIASVLRPHQGVISIAIQAIQPTQRNTNDSQRNDPTNHQHHNRKKTIRNMHCNS